MSFSAAKTQRKVLLLFSEVEFVFAFWGGVLLLILLIANGTSTTFTYFTSLSFIEPLFVLTILIVCSAGPILKLAKHFIFLLTRLIPLSRGLASLFVLLTVSPLFGSLISEPAAMTVTSLILAEYLKDQKISLSAKYALLGLLFVNISLGGILTPFAAPPIIMVAKTWNWDLHFTWTHFGLRTILTILLSTTLIMMKNYKEFNKLIIKSSGSTHSYSLINTFFHILILCLVILNSHNFYVFSALLIIFILVHTFIFHTLKTLKIKEGIYVFLFLSGLVILGPEQKWWLEDILTSISPLMLYFSSIVLTSFTDNAALTYLGSQVPGLSSQAQYYLVAGSVVGGGLTIIANAPNPIGYQILNPFFEKDGISPFRLFLNALVPTLIALVCFL